MAKKNYGLGTGLNALFGDETPGAPNGTAPDQL